MKIGFDAKRAFFNESGLGNYCRSTIELLSRSFPMHEYFLFTPDIENSISFTIRDNTKILKPKSWFDKKLKSYWRSFKLSKYIRENKLDIYHGLSNELPQNAHKTGAKVIVTIHDLIFIRYPELYSKFDRKVYYQKLKYACEIADTIIAISEQTKTDIINFFNVDESKIEVIYQSCSPIFYEDTDPSCKIEVTQKYNLPKKYILFIGEIEKRKNVLSIVKAVNEMSIDFPVVIIGKQSGYQKEIEDYIAKYNLEDQIIVKNNIPFSDFPAIYQQAKLFIYPSVFEGFGMPIVEALFSKVPVITTKGGCFSETGGLSSIYVDSKNVEELGEAIKRVLNDSELQKKMISEGFEFVQKFKEEFIVSDLMNLYLK